jgi:hypothetical protein
MQSKNTFQKRNKKRNVKIPFKAKMPFRSAIQNENALRKRKAKSHVETNPKLSQGPFPFNTFNLFL